MTATRETGYGKKPGTHRRDIPPAWSRADCDGKMGRLRRKPGLARAVARRYRH